MRRLFLLALLLLGGVALYAALSFINYARWSVNASLPPVSKNLNTSVYPLAKAWYQYQGEYNVTYYYIKFMPGWPELYTAGIFYGRDPGWSARLEALSRSGNPGDTYAIALGNAVQITPTQDSGPYVPTTVPLVWQNAATSRYSVLARAWFNQGGITAVQLVNFTAEPMSMINRWTFSCGTSAITDGFNYCTSYSLSYGWDGASNTTLFTPRPYQVVTKGAEAWVEVSSTVGNPRPSLRLLVDGADTDGYGVAALVIDFSTTPLSTESQISIQHLYGYTSGDTRNNIGYLEFLVKLANGTYVRLYLVRDDLGSYSTRIYDVVGGSAQYVCTYTTTAVCTAPSGHVVVRLGTLSFSWTTFFSGSIFQYVGPGQIEKIALVAVDYGFVTGKWSADFYIYWDNLQISGASCSLPSGVSAIASGGQYTAVYPSPSVSPTSAPSLATEVDASSGVGYAVARYWLSQRIPAAGTAVSVWGRYVRDAADAQNNAAFVAVGVDLDGDGVVDREYVYYMVDAASGQRYALVSSFISPGAVVCDQPSGGACANTTQFYFKYLGTMSSGSNYQWSVQLGDVPGAVVAVAFGVVDYSGTAAGTANDFWVYWDDLSIRYSACPPPSGWSSTGYVWQSYNYLLVTGGTAYVNTVQNALTYVANFTGVGKYVALTSALADAFGVYWRGSTSGCVYGLNPPPPTAKWVELRPLSGLGDVIVRDSAGNILTRYGCQNPPATAYIGFKTAPGEILKVYSLEVWGMG